MTLSPLSGDGSEGASWRMVVELGPTVRAWSIYPGGPSNITLCPPAATRSAITASAAISMTRARFIRPGRFGKAVTTPP